MNFDTKPNFFPRILQIAALDADNGLGKGGKIPWQIPEEQAFFRDQTLGHVLFFGRVTYRSLGRPTLPDRRIVVLSRHIPAEAPRIPDDGIFCPVCWCDSLERALRIAGKTEDTVFIGGGAALYADTMPFADELLLSRIPGHYACDTFYPPIPSNMALTHTRCFPKFTVHRYMRGETHAHTLQLNHDAVGNDSAVSVASTNAGETPTSPVTEISHR